MPTVRPVFNDFSAGELSPRLAGRVDLPVYYRGAQEMTNFRTRVLGGVSKRPGTKFVKETLASAKARLIPWSIDNDRVFILELTAGHIRILDHASGGLVTVSGGTAVDLATSYTAAELFEVRYAQTYREMYLVHPNHAPVWFRYASGAVSAAVIDYTAADQSFAGNLIEWTAAVGTYELYDLWEHVAQWLAVRKSYTATGTFNGKTLASVVRTDLSITLTFSDASTLVLDRATSYSYQGSISIDLRPFMGTGNYPGAVAFSSGRLWLGGSINDPAVLWGSKPWDYKNFVLFEEIVYSKQEKTEAGRVGADFTATSASASATLTGLNPAVVAGALVGKYASGQNIAYGSIVLSNTTTEVVMDKVALAATTFSVAFSAWKDALVPEYVEVEDTTQQVGAGSAIRLRLATEEDERIVWIAASQDLYVGTVSSEWMIPGTSTAVQARAVMASRYGSASIQARFVGDGLLYVAPASRHIRQLSQGLSQPITLQADHIVSPGIIQLDFQQTPEVAVYAALANGQLARCIMEPTASVMAWDRMVTRAGDAIESVAVIPGTTRDYVYVSVQRTIGGSVKRFIEVIQDNEDDTVQNQWYLDSAVQKTAAAFTTVTGLWHLEGESVSIRYIPSDPATGTEAVVTRVVTSGQVTIPSATHALAGLPYLARLKLNRIESTDTEGLEKGIGRVFFRLFRSSGFTMKHSDTAGAPSTPVVLSGYTGPLQVTTDIPSQIDAFIIIESSEPVPVGIQTIAPETEIGG